MKSNFMKQAGILAAAGIICRVIGLLYRSPLTSILGDEGNGYYSPAYNIYTIVLLLSSYNIPIVVSKLMAQKIALKEYRDANIIFKMSFLYVMLLCALASVFIFIGAPYVLLDDNAVIVLKVFAPTIFLSGMLGVLRGYFQAYGTMVQTSLSQILEQITNAVFSIGLAYFFITSAVTEDATVLAVRGAVGSAVGTGMGVLAALVFMASVYFL